VIVLRRAARARSSSTARVAVASAASGREQGVPPAGQAADHDGVDGDLVHRSDDLPGRQRPGRSAHGGRHGGAAAPGPCGGRGRASQALERGCLLLLPDHGCRRRRYRQAERVAWRVSFGCRGRRECLNRCITLGLPVKIRNPGLHQVGQECRAHHGLLGGVARSCPLPACVWSLMSSAGLASRLVPRSRVASGFTTRDGPHNDPHEPARPPARRGAAARRGSGGAGLGGQDSSAPDPSEAAFPRSGWLAGAGGWLR
jgi:hypothetical protein